MAETTADGKPSTNGATFVEVVGDSEEYQGKPRYQNHQGDGVVTLFTILNNLITAIVFPQPGTQYASAPLLYRIKASLSENVPLLREASKNSAHHVLQWTRRGSPLRALFVVSVGTIASLLLTGMLVFMLFFVAATVNAVVIALLISLAAAGGFLALFFACVTAIYIGALSVAVFVISATTISAIVAVIIAAGWIGFFLTVWLATKASVSLAKRSLSMTSSALSGYSYSRHALHDNESTKKSE